MKLSIILCAHNWRDTILSTLNRLWEAAPAGWQVEAIVIDNHSTDGTRDMLQGLEMANLQVIYQPRRQREGACWRAAAVHLSGDYVLIDRLLPERTPTDLAPLLAEARRGAVAVYTAPPGEPDAPENRDLTTRLVNALFGGDLRDVLGGSKLIRGDVAKALNLHGDGPSFDIALTTKLLRARIKIQQVTLEGHTRTPKKRIGASALWTLLSARLGLSPIWKAGQRPAPG